MSSIADTYDDLIESGAEIEDARGVLPTNIHTNIMVKFDLRTLADTMRKRASGRTQGEYRAVLDGMVKTVLAVHPWASLFFDRTFDKAAGELESAVLGLGDHIGKGEVTRLVKLIDQMRTTA
jgi:thymidylate synthase ThyX